MRVEVWEDAAPMRDGVRLRADVTTVPEAGPRPALLIRTPYSRGGARLTHDVVGLARGGWAVVVQDVRGRFESEGDFVPFGQEVEDGHDTVGWCAAQPWCDGRVAMTGWSYVGATQWLAALGGHPALKVINPVVGAGDIGEAMLHDGGAFQVGLAQPWALGMAASDPRADDATRQRAGQLGAAWRETLAVPAHRDPVGEVFAPYAGWRGRTGPAQGGVAGRYGELDVAVFQIAGWYDVFCESALRHYAGLAAHSTRPQRLVIGPWSHSNNLSNLHPEHDFGGEANGGYAGVLAQALDWSRRVLDDEPVDSGVSCFVMGEDRWLELPSWPPATDDRVLFDGEGEDLTLRHDPADPVPTRGGRVLGPFLPMAGPVDQRPLAGHPGVAALTGPLLTGPLRVVGAVRLRTGVSSDAGTFDLVARLCDVHPDGRVHNVVEGVRRGGSGDLDMVLGSTAHTFLPGHRVQLQLATSSFPRLDVTPEPTQVTVRMSRTSLHLPEQR